MSGAKLGPEILAAVEKALPGPADAPLRTLEVFRRLDPPHWARGSVRHALEALTRAGRAEKIPGSLPCGLTYFFRSRRRRSSGSR